MHWYSRVRHVKRHFAEVLPYLTLRKIYNLQLSLLEKHLRKTKLRSSPVVLKIEPTPFCQLHCPHCHHSNPNLNKKFALKDNLTLNKLRQIIEPLKKKLIWVSLSHRGEPFLNSEILDCIEYLHENRISVSFITNFSIKLNDEKIERLVKSGLDKLFVSLDGASEETYSKYRIGGNFNLILDNVKRLSETKKRLGVKKPKIVWKFIVFDHNRKEKKYVRENYMNFGFDSYEFPNDNGGSTMAKERIEGSRKRLNASVNCYWLWHSTVIRSDGQLNVCCNEKNFQIGNVFDLLNVGGLWNSKAYQDLRNGFNKDNFPDNLHIYCKECYFKGVV